jgi:signal transduction histidine kinase
VTLAFSVAMALVLIATGLFVYLRQRAQLDDTINQGLYTRAADVASLLHDSRLGGAGQVRFSEQDEGFTQILTPSGRVLYSTSGLPHRDLLTRSQLRQAVRDPILFDVSEGGGLHSPSRILAKPATQRGRPLVLVAGGALDDRNDALRSLATQLLIGGAAALILASLAGYLAISSALRPVEAMRRRAAEVSAAESGLRLPLPPADDELRRLAETLNRMLGRLEATIERERAFVDDASHELRTPLALHRAELELALRYGASEEELRAAITSAIAEAERLGRLAEDLLVLARSNEGRLAIRLEPVETGRLLDTVRDRMNGLAAEEQRKLRVDGDGHATIEGDRLRLEQALTNLVDNAIRHGEGEVRLWSRAVPEGVRLGVSDEGGGFDPEFLPRAFQRFSRADRARTGEGTGLGLAIAAAIAEAHHGSAGATNRDGGGTDVWIDLPLHAADGHGGAPAA